MMHPPYANLRVCRISSVVAPGNFFFIIGARSESQEESITAMCVITEYDSADGIRQRVKSTIVRRSSIHLKSRQTEGGLPVRLRINRPALLCHKTSLAGVIY